MILVCCGPPGVGKTTVAERLQRRLEERGHEFCLLHSDDFSRNTYEQMHDRVTVGERDANHDTDSSPDHDADSSDRDADHPTDWLLDGTFYRREYQERFRTLPDAHLVYLTANLETALERNQERANPIDEVGVRAMHGKFEEPEHPDLTLDTDEASVAEAVDALERYVLTWENSN